MREIVGRRAAACIAGIALLGACGTEGGGGKAAAATTSPEQSSWTFETRYGGGFNKKGSPIEGRGEVTVDTEAGEVCFEQQILGASSAHLHREEGDAILTFFEPPQEFRPTICVTEVPDEALEEIVSNPESFYIEFHNRNSGGTLTSPLHAVGS